MNASLDSRAPAQSAKDAKDADGPDTSLRAGELLEGRFVLTRELGRGGMGTVWAATHAVTGRPFAVKLLHERRAQEPGAAARLLREARASCAATHATILPVDDVLTLSDGRHALVMELLEGESLRACLDREGALPLDRVTRIFEPVLDGLAAAHAAGIIHRDLKPDNIFLVASEPPVRILDFGIAQSTLEDAPSLTSTGAMLGTPYYMAPEQAFGEGTKGAATDVWSLGIVIFECLTGTRPTQAANLGQVLRLMSEERLPKLEHAGLPIGRRLASTIDRMLSRKPEDRPSIAEVRAAFASDDDDDAQAVPSAKSKKRSSRVLSALGIAAILSLGAAAFLTAGRPHAQTSARATAVQPLDEIHVDRTQPSAPQTQLSAPLTETVSLPIPSVPAAVMPSVMPLKVSPQRPSDALPTSTTSSATHVPGAATKGSPRSAPTIVENPPY